MNRNLYVRYKDDTRQRMPASRIFLYSLTIFLGIVLIVGTAGYLYAISLVNLVEPIEFTGDANFNEQDLNPTVPGATVRTGHDMPAAQPTDHDMPDAQVKIYESQAEAAKQAITPLADKNIYNILLIGSDNRGDAPYGNSDSMIIVSVNKTTKKIHMTSLMRALYVNVQGRGYTLLNGAFAFGGPKLLIKTINDTFRLQIQDYAYIDFNGFTKAINTIGGVSVTLTAAEAEHLQSEGHQAITGKSLLTGEAALAYSRIRYIDSDFVRTGRQRNVIQAVIEKTRTLSIGQIDALARQILPSIKSNRTGSSMFSLILEMADCRSYPISQLMIPVPNSAHRSFVRGMEVYPFDLNKNIEALHNFIKS